MAAAYLTVQSTPGQKRSPGYDPNQPRDKDGKWVDTGASVRNTITRAVGTVLAHIPGAQGSEAHFSVRLADGSNASWERSAVQVVRNPDGSTPSVNPPSTQHAPAAPGGDATAALAAIRSVTGGDTTNARERDTRPDTGPPDPGGTEAAGAYANRIPRKGDVVLLRDGREGEVNYVYADGKTIRFSVANQPVGRFKRERIPKTDVEKITYAMPGEGDAPRGPNLDGIQHLPADIRQELTDAVQEMTALYDVPFGGLTAREEDWHGGSSFAHGGTRIAFNPRIADPEFRANTLDSGYVLARTMREAFIHEFGHTIDRQYVADGGAGKLHKDFAAVINSGGGSQIGEDNPLFDPADPDSVLWIYPDGTRGDLVSRVSLYADANPGEAMAEAFLAGHLGRTNRYTLAVRDAFAPYVRHDGDTASATGDVVEPPIVRPLPGPDVTAMTPAALRREADALRESLRNMSPSDRAWGPTRARENLLFDEVLRRSGPRPSIQPAPEPTELDPLPQAGKPDASGTREDPIEVGADLARAASLLAEGKHIRLSQPDEVATLLDKLRETVEDARSRGDKAPNYDLCKVSVPKTNLFCQQSKNIPRARMPQFRGEIVPGSPAEVTRRANGRGNIEPLFRDALAGLGLPIRRDTMPASHLRASQSELDGVKVAQMAAAMERGDVPDTPIFVSRDGYVIDGHHRWAAKVALDTADNRLGDVQMDVEIVDMDIGAAIDYASDFARAMGIAPKEHGQYVPDHPTTLLAKSAPTGGIKAGGGSHFNPNQPRDKNGKWVETGAELRNSLSRVTGTVLTHLPPATPGGEDKYRVRLPGGGTADWERSAVEVVHNADGSRPGVDPRGDIAAVAQSGTPSAPDASSATDARNAIAAVAARGSATASAPTASGTAAGDVASARRTELTDEQYQAHTQAIEDSISAAFKAGTTTDAMFTLDPGRSIWSPERAAQHKQIIDDLWARNASVPREGRGIIAGGLGGAGKSTVLGKFAGVDQSQYMTINPDDVKELMANNGMIPDMEGLSPMEASAIVHEESSHIANLLAQRAYDERMNVIWDITMSSRGSTERRIQEMRANGYDDMQAIFVDIPVETSVSRALARHRRGMEDHRSGTGLGGRYVPPSIIRKNADSEFSSANRRVFEELRGQFDGWQSWDNSVTGRAPQPIESSADAAAAPAA